MAVAEMIIKALPDIAGKIAEPLSRVDKITNIGGSADAGVESVANGGPTVMAKLIESMKETTGVDLAEALKAETYDAKVTRNVNLSGIPETTPAGPVIINTDESSSKKIDTAGKDSD